MHTTIEQHYISPLVHSPLNSDSEIPNHQRHEKLNGFPSESISLILLEYSVAIFKMPR